MNTKLLVVLALAFFMLGCGNTQVNAEKGKANIQQVEESKASHVVTQETAYYSSSPAQARPADGVLETGVKVNIIEDAGSYKLVETEAGIRGYVSSSALKIINPK